MSRMPLLAPDTAPVETRPLLEKTVAQLGRLPNLYAAMANAPAALAGYLAFRGELVKGTLPPALREQIALLVAEENTCVYCVSAHTFRGQKLGLAPDTLIASRRAQSADPQTAAALAFARALLREKGRVSDALLAETRAQGWDDAALGEIAAHVALNVFSNLFNHLAEPALDFPRTELLEENGQ